MSNHELFTKINNLDQAIQVWKRRKAVQMQVLEELEEAEIQGFVYQKVLDTIGLIDNFISDLTAIRESQKAMHHE